eukprot:2822814-Prymnesium_polylepis.1
MVLGGAREAARVGVHEEVQITPVRHHPWNGVRVSVHGHEDSPVGIHEWGGVANAAGPLSVHGKGAERRQVEDVLVIALRNVEALDELLTKGAGETGAVRVVAELWGRAAVVVDQVRIEEDVDMVRLERPRSWLACAALFASHGMSVRVREVEAGHEKEGELLDHRHSAGVGGRSGRP